MNQSNVPYLSIIIPTHNRASMLTRLLENLRALQQEEAFEVIVVDNNSKDDTKLIAAQFDFVRYVFEPNTSFTRARLTGAEHALGEIVLYFDDDVVVKSGTIKAIREIFTRYPTCGVAGGKILHLFEVEPPLWILDLQKSFNGFSLYDLGDQEREVHAIPGPMMAIKRSVFFAVGGFPPDTIGVETNAYHKTFKKLYVGPGDYGLCLLIRNAGYKIFYSPAMAVQHIIPPMRLTKEFWISRMIGEGHCAALTKYNMPVHEQSRQRGLGYVLKMMQCYLSHHIRGKKQRLMGTVQPLLVDEMWAHYYYARLRMEWVLKRNPGLAAYIWELGYKGVDDNNFEAVLKKLPKDYQKLAL